MAHRWVAFVLGAALFAGPAIPGARAGGDDPKTPDEAVAKVRPMLEAPAKALAVKDKDTDEFKRIGDALRGALDILKGQSKEGFKRPEYQTLWNEAVSLSHFHGLKNIPAFQLEFVEMGVQPIRMGLPVGRGWKFQPMRPGQDDQQWGAITRTLGEAKKVREIKIWVYSWNTVYSGVGGENAKGMAEMMMESDRFGMKKVSFRSNRIVTARMGRGFPKTSFYEISGEDEAFGPMRRRNYYAKGTTSTYCFEVLEYRKTEAAPGSYERWQAEGDDPELDAVLDAMEDVGDKRKGK